MRKSVCETLFSACSLAAASMNTHGGGLERSCTKYTNGSRKKTNRDEEGQGWGNKRVMEKD